MSTITTDAEAQQALHADYDWLLWAVRGNRDAADFLHMFFLVCHLWDDLVDKDVERTEDHINHAFWIAFVDVPRNLYYRRHCEEIQPVMAVAIQEWFAANKLEADRRKDIAYTLRCSIVSLIHQAAEICGGYEWAVDIGEAIRQHTQAETYEEYLGEFKCQTSAPESQPD